MRLRIPALVLISILISGCVAGGGAVSLPETPAATITPGPSPVTTKTTPRSQPDPVKAKEESCLHFSQQELVVCSAYILHISYAARWAYYKLGNSTSQFAARQAKSSLQYRYTGAALDQIRRQTADWPPSDQLDTYPPYIHIDSVQVEGNSAIIHSHETWLVKTEAGQELFAQNNVAHTVRLARISGGILPRKWVVTSITNLL